MSRLLIIRFGLVIFMRDLLIPGAGVFILIYGWIKGTLEPWHLPLIAGMVGTPLIGRGSTPPAPNGNGSRND